MSNAKRVREYSVDEDDRTLPEFLRDVALAPFRILTSPLASRICVRTTLLVIATLTLLTLSVTAYTIFYYNYIPSLGFVQTLHLQFSPGFEHHPFALAKVAHNEIKSEQAYDTVVTLCLPQTHENLGAGNFMVSLEVRGPEEVLSPADSAKAASSVTELVAPVLARSSRPALLLPEDGLVRVTRRFLRLPLLVLGLARETQCLRVPVFESLSFERGWRNQPDVVKLELAVQGGPWKTLMVQDVSMEWTARLQGLRWVVWNHRIISFVVGVTSFWLTSLTSTAIVWVVLSYVISSGGRSKAASAQNSRSVAALDRRSRLKVEDEYDSPTDLSDFKKETSPGQRPLDAEEHEADDEDEDADFITDEPGLTRRLTGDDLGIGTSSDSGRGGRSSLSHRKGY